MSIFTLRTSRESSQSFSLLRHYGRKWLFYFFFLECTIVYSGGGLQTSRRTYNTIFEFPTIVINSSIIILITTVIIIALFNLINAMDDTSCVTNSDCSPGQYCYGLSQTCVDYTRCSRYNRQEGPKHAETPRHCGPCIDGQIFFHLFTFRYAAELLATGTRATICKKNLQQENKSFPNDTENSAWIYIASGIILCIIIIGSLACFAKNRITHHGSEKWFKKMAGWNFTPTAPPPDTGSYHLQTFFNDEPPIYSSVINNNTNAKDRNNLVSAVPFRPPDWIDLTQNYDVPDNSTDNAVMPTSHIENIDEETNPSTWVPEQMTVQIPARVFHQFAPEQRDNALNNVLNRSDCAVNTESTNDTNSPGPAGSSTTGNSRTGQNYRGPNVQINQMITLNMVNTDN
ncbi:hypothetical protein PV328_011131 [Microctonus aethiopoides]|uniref:Uncharacterized protein n=1 Tax=Microctonus aethiopoides TaxID=144406 RepID=A0AA39C3S4_9HYME|nr:hypothetical protein PV328_011131 [Microctonus aethiopoides]